MNLRELFAQFFFSLLHHYVNCINVAWRARLWVKVIHYVLSMGVLEYKGLWSCIIVLYSSVLR